MREQLETCPHCHYTLIKRTTYCPYCGTQLTHPLWKKIGAWLLLIAIAYAFIKCNVRLMEGFEPVADDAIVGRPASFPNQGMEGKVAHGGPRPSAGGWRNPLTLASSQ